MNQIKNAPHQSANEVETQGKGNNLDPHFEFDKTLLPEEIINEIDGLNDIKEETTGEQLLLSDIKEIPCLIEPFLQQTGLACLAGSSDTGKSSFLRQLAIKIVTGEPDCIGFKINAKHRSVIYVSTEDLERETAYLLFRQSTNYLPKNLKGLRFVFEINNLLKELDKRLSNNLRTWLLLTAFLMRMEAI